MYFYPRPPRGGRPGFCRFCRCCLAISIHALREEGDDFCTPVYEIWLSISIHALREEGDLCIPCACWLCPKFLSTPSARRATMEQIRRRINNGISIHALREEGDVTKGSFMTGVYNFYPRPPRGGRRGTKRADAPFQKFLSTPSARRATACSKLSKNPKKISIHALREEGDSKNRDKISIFL